MIRPRSGSYAVSVYDPAVKRKRWVGTFKTLREAREAERDASQRRGVGGRVTCGEYVELWLAVCARASPEELRGDPPGPAWVSLLVEPPGPASFGLSGGRASA